MAQTIGTEEGVRKLIQLSLFFSHPGIGPRGSTDPFQEAWDLAPWPPQKLIPPSFAPTQAQHIFLLCALFV